jgi:hypothetical protein
MMKSAIDHYRCTNLHRQRNEVCTDENNRIYSLRPRSKSTAKWTPRSKNEVRTILWPNIAESNAHSLDNQTNSDEISG